MHSGPGSCLYTYILTDNLFHNWVAFSMFDRLVLMAYEVELFRLEILLR